MHNSLMTLISIGVDAHSARVPRRLIRDVHEMSMHVGSTQVHVMANG